MSSEDKDEILILPVRRALISVSDKTGLAPFARGLHELGVEIVSTGGTARFLDKAGVPVLPVAELTGFPEILDGRVKTLHPRIHGGLLADRSRASHLGQLKEHGIAPIDLVAVNLYPFEQTVAAGEASFEETVEMIDIGGPTMVRAAAKNHQGVVVVVDPADYGSILETLAGDERSVPPALRRGLAAKAFRHTRDYDTAIASWMEAQGGEAPKPTAPEGFPDELHFSLVKEMEPRYGENPHQEAAIYRYRGGPGLFGGFRQLQGKELSWNNLLDADAARKMASQLEDPGVVIVKHNNPCGVGVGRTPKSAYERALATDPISAFGSVIAFNRPVGGKVAKVLKELFVEVVLAPSFDEEAQQIFAKKKRLRLLECPAFEPAGDPWDLRTVSGGFLAQGLDAGTDEASSWTCPTKKKPTAAQRRALAFAWKVCRYVKSNAIVLANRVQTVGIGAGQMSRVDSCRLAIEKAQLPTEGSVAASDAFFPFRDGLDVLAKAGVVAIVQPGGSMRDQEIIDAADEQGLILLHTGRRHFRH